MQSNGKAEPCKVSASLVVCWKQQEQQQQKKMQLYVGLETMRKMWETQTTGLPAAAHLYYSTVTPLAKKPTLLISEEL